jgi:molybdopterin-guanine dinucleotide biosynthesis protein B
MQAAIALVGYKDTGKTSLAIELVREFKGQGLSVAAAKCTEHGLDAPKTDTWRLSQIADVVAGIGPKQTCLNWPRPYYLLDLLPLLQADVLIVEGCKTQKWLPRILLGTDQNPADAALDPGLALGGWGSCLPQGLRRFDDVKDLAKTILDKGFILPGLDCGSCGRADCAELARQIIAQKATPAACQAKKSEMTLRVNGQDLGLNPFVREIIGGSIRGMLKQLKGFAPGQVEITLEV